jgi:hypothetical protein
VGTSVKEFNVAVAELEAEQQGEDGKEPEGTKHFSIDGNECTAYKPGDGQLAVLMAATGRHSSQQEQVAGIINFFASVLDDESNAYVVARLLNRKDPFGLEQVQEIMEWLIAEWSGRPTKSSPASTPSQQTTGQRSTDDTPVSI